MAQGQDGSGAAAAAAGTAPPPSLYGLYRLDDQRLPVVISVPHAGRHYPPAMAAMIRLSIDQLHPLEDRFADQLASAAIAAGACAIVAHRPRAWIDLNRSEREFDPLTVHGAPAGAAMPSAKVRGGLGIIPHRLANAGPIWRDTISAAAFEARLASDYRPYHAQLADLLETTRARFGRAMLIDLHSMPPLACDEGRPPHVVIGDRFGRAARHRIADVAAAAARRSGYRTAINTPYAGGHILERHGAPHRGVDAIQIEISRDCYLDEALTNPGAGLPGAQALVASIVLALASEHRL